MSEMRQHLPDWVTALEGECQVQGYEDQIEHQPSRHLGVRPRGYLRICWDMIGYERIS